MPRRAARFICVTPVRALRTPASLPLFLFPRTLGVGWLVQRIFCLRSVLQGASSPFLLSRRATPRIRLWRKRPLRVHPTAVTARYLSATPALAFRTAHQRPRAFRSSPVRVPGRGPILLVRSEEHTSELQSR